MVITQADGIGNQDALARLLQREAGGIELIRQYVHRTLVADG
jgi:hypothetical protein